MLRDAASPAAPTPQWGTCTRGRGEWWNRLGQVLSDRFLQVSGCTGRRCDVIAREILEPGRPALVQVAARFGDDLIREDGTLDRAGLARRVFAGEGADERVAALNAITHPAIERRAWEILNAAPAGTLAVYDIPLLVEGDYADRFDAVVIVDAPVEQRVARLEGRGVPPEDARARRPRPASV